MNWAGKPLRTWDTLVAFIRGTTTTTSQDVQAERLEGTDTTGLRVSEVEMATLNLRAYAVCPSWDNTIRPRSAAVLVPATHTPNREVVFDESLLQVMALLPL